MPKTLHVFSGQFASLADACAYSDEQWEEPASDDSWSEEEWTAYEDRNPSWALLSDVDGVYMNSDFIETIDGSDRMEYLRTQIEGSEDFEALEQAIPRHHNILVLIMSEAIDDSGGMLRSTPKLTYHGEYRWSPS